MSAYRTVVVGTDGSASSLRAVARAANIAGAEAKLIIASAYLPQHEDVYKRQLPPRSDRRSFTLQVSVDPPQDSIAFAGRR